MATETEPWFVTERSEALAAALLTTSEDVRVREERGRDGSLDLVAEIRGEAPLSLQLFVVRVKGTTSSDPGDWRPGVEALFHGHASPPHVPVCVFVVDVRENRAFYAWAAEPMVEPKGATLRSHEVGTFRSLTPATVGEIIDRVRTWYDALARQLTPA
ncbi:DUF4365 domain-containing protein [Aquisphaera insulae]|uniref:DUF4365 domain-containing protein n=1 Tax=Aquisphaera insulae TaxID=2712864 RepID=UPI0013E9E97F|nr:DUF4365 domain-containing protein [Aquisphaera insulae]